MLRVKQTKGLFRPGSAGLEFELLVARVLRGLGIQAERVSFAGVRQTSGGFDRQRVWAPAPSGETWGLLFESGQASPSRRTVYILSLSLADATSPPWQPPSSQGEAEVSEAVFRLLDCRGAGCGTVSICTAELTLPTQLPDECRTIAFVGGSFQRLRYRLQLQLAGAGLEGFEQEFWPVRGKIHAACVFGDHVKGGLAGRVTIGGLSLTAGTIIFQIGDGIMESESKVGLTLELGQFELSAEDLLGLRPGSQIQMEVPQASLGLIRHAGVAMAEAEVTLSSDCLNVRVTKLIDHPLGTQLFFASHDKEGAARAA